MARGLIFTSAEWTPLKGGRTNWVWRVSGPEGDIVVKLYAGAARNPLFPNDPDSEALVLQHLQPHGIAPRLLDHFATDVGQCLVYEHLRGNTWFKNAADAAQLLSQLHQITPPQTLRETPSGSVALSRQTLAILDRCPDEKANELRPLMPHVCIAESGTAHLLHADPVPANLIEHAGQLRLIDWQCPAIGDPCEDLSIFLSPAMHMTYRGCDLNAKEITAFLAAYPDRDVVARYLQLAPWYHWRMAAYCLWKEAQGDPEAPKAGKAEIRALRSTLSEQE